MALLDHPGVRQVAVVPQEGRNGDIKLAAYIVPASGPRPSNDQLRALLKKSLPDYMIPSVYVDLMALPLTPTGKIDRNSLPKPNNTRPRLDVAYVPFRNETERQLIGIWEDALDVNPIGIHDNFFDLGGHSLTASQIVSRVLQRFQLQITLQDLFQAATVADMAAVLAEYPEKRLSNDDLKIILDELESLSDEHAQRLVHEGRHPSSKA
jgi:acyl carrier protein